MIDPDDRLIHQARANRLAAARDVGRHPYPAGGEYRLHPREAVMTLPDELEPDGMHSPWFPSEIVPARHGVYQRDYGDPGMADLCFCKWDGVHWYAQCEDPEYAAVEQCISLVSARWRGLTLAEFVDRHRDAARVLNRIIQDSKP